MRLPPDVFPDFSSKDPLFLKPSLKPFSVYFFLPAPTAWHFLRGAWGLFNCSKNLDAKKKNKNPSWNISFGRAQMGFTAPGTERRNKNTWRGKNSLRNQNSHHNIWTQTGGKSLGIHVEYSRKFFVFQRTKWLFIPLGVAGNGRFQLGNWGNSSWNYPLGFEDLWEFWCGHHKMTPGAQNIP